MGPPITFTLDVEDHRPDESAELRFPMVTQRVLEFLSEQGIRATVFVVGEVAADQPDLVRRISARGHEVGLHAWRHEPLTTVDRKRFREDTRRGKETLEDLTGAPVRGFRAPTFSLVEGTTWVTDDLTEMGFVYSASVLPASNPLFGYPKAPRDVFRWPSGLVELPAPVAGLGRLSLPVLGGVYFRVLPWPVVRAAHAVSRSTSTPFFYCHPYDFDPDEPYWVVPDSGRWGSRLLWLNRRAMFRKVERLFSSGAAPPLGERLAAAEGAVVYRPTGRPA